MQLKLKVLQFSLCFTLSRYMQVYFCSSFIENKKALMQNQQCYRRSEIQVILLIIQFILLRLSEIPFIILFKSAFSIGNCYNICIV